MGLDNTSMVDAIGIEVDTGLAVLTITDSWDWIDEKGHLLALQDKLNAYFDFIETGQIWDAYPKAQGRQLAIDVITKFRFPPAATDFLEKARQAATELNVVIRERYIPENH